MPLSLQFQLSPEIKGIILCLLAYFCFTCGDAVIKVLGPHYPGLQIFFLNMVASALMGFVVVLLTSNVKNLRIHWFWLHLTRGLLLLMMRFSAPHTFTHVPLGSAYVLVFSAPLITVILAHFWLKENIQPQLWACVGTGFVGVVICLQPGSAGVASRTADSLIDWHWAFNVEPASTTIWPEGESPRLNVDEHSNSRCRQLLDSLHGLLATFTVGLVRLAFVVWPARSDCRHCNHWGVSIDPCFLTWCFPI